MGANAPMFQVTGTKQVRIVYVIATGTKQSKEQAHFSCPEGGINLVIRNKTKGDINEE